MKKKTRQTILTLLLASSLSLYASDHKTPDKSSGSKPALTKNELLYNLGAEASENSNANNYDSGMKVEVNDRTGQLNITFKGKTVLGYDNALSVDLGISYGGNYSEKYILGLPGGWTYSIPYLIRGEEVLVFGGSRYKIDFQWQNAEGYHSGLRYYNLESMQLSLSESGNTPLPFGSGRKYLYTLKQLEGSVTYFNQDGLMIAVLNKYGDFTELFYKNSQTGAKDDGSVYEVRLDYIRDSYKQRTEFSYPDGSSTNMQIVYPDNTRLTYDLRGGNINSITDEAGETTIIEYDSKYSLPASISYPSGKQQLIKYGDVISTGGNKLPAVVEVRAFPSGIEYSQEQCSKHGGVCKNEIIISYQYENGGDNNQHNFLGYSTDSSDNHIQGGVDGLLQSNDNNYTYQVTKIAGGQVIDSVYNHLHLMVSQQISELADGASNARGKILSQSEYSYLDMSPDTNDYFPAYDKLPANYQQPKLLDAKIYDENSSGANEKFYRHVQTKTNFNNYGQKILQEKYTNDASSSDKLKLIQQTKTEYYSNGKLGDLSMGTKKSEVSAYCSDIDLCDLSRNQYTQTKGVSYTPLTKGSLNQYSQSTIKSKVSTSGLLMANDTQAVSTDLVLDEHGREISNTVSWVTGKHKGVQSVTTTKDYEEYQDKKSGNLVMKVHKTVSYIEEDGNLSADNKVSSTVINLTTGKKTQSIDGMGYVTKYYYDPKGRPWYIEYPNGLFKVTQYLSAGNKNNNTKLSYYAQDDSGRVTLQEMPANATYVYNTLSRPESYETLPEYTHMTINYVNGNNKAIANAVKNPLGQNNTYIQEKINYNEYGQAEQHIAYNYANGTHEANGGLVRYTNALPTISTFDSKGRVIKQAFADNSQKLTEYDDVNNAVLERFTSPAQASLLQVPQSMMISLYRSGSPSSESVCLQANAVSYKLLNDDMKPYLEINCPQQIRRHSNDLSASDNLDPMIVKISYDGEHKVVEQQSLTGQ